MKYFYLLFTLFIPTLSDTHSLQYLCTAVTSGINYPEFTVMGQVDGELYEYYDSNIKRTIIKTEWIKKVTADDPHYLDRETEHWLVKQKWFKNDVFTAMECSNQSEGLHTVQFMYGCELDDDGTTREYSKFGYDGEDFSSLDLNTKTWTAVTKPEFSENKWKPTGQNAERCARYLKHECVDTLKKFVSLSREILERKVRPEVSVFHKHSPSPAVVCHATGFFPKSLSIFWQKDGEDVNEDVALRETSPNPDGSFQKRIILTVPAEELQKHNYTCVVQHSSLEKHLVLRVRTEDGGSDGGQIGIIVGVVVALVALVAVVVGFVVQKDKSGFRRVPPKPSSEGDSSTNISTSSQLSSSSL